MTIKKIMVWTMALGLLVSCQTEIEEITPQEETNNLSQSEINLLLNIARLDGSPDNIVDGASCFSIQLPFTVIVNDTELLIETEEDYEVIEALF